MDRRWVPRVGLAGIEQFAEAVAAHVSPSIVSARFAVHVVRAQCRHRHLEEAGELEHRRVFLVPADIAAAVAWARLVDGAAAVLAEELAGAEAGLDALAALAVALDDMPGLELAHREAEELRQPPDVVAADLDIAGGAAAEGRAFQAIQRIVAHGGSLGMCGPAGKRGGTCAADAADNFWRRMRLICGGRKGEKGFHTRGHREHTEGRRRRSRHFARSAFRPLGGAPCVLGALRVKPFLLPSYATSMPPPRAAID